MKFGFDWSKRCNHLQDRHSTGCCNRTKYVRDRLTTIYGSTNTDYGRNNKEDNMTDLIKCTKCREEHDESWFATDYRRRSARTPWCRRCLRAASRLRRTGLDQEAYDALLANQESRCGICRTAFDRDCQPRIDRTAADGIVRGLLCPRCKVGVATFRDDEDVLRAAVEYLLSGTGNQPAY
jgi:hypothetical protein